MCPKSFRETKIINTLLTGKTSKKYNFGAFKAFGTTFGLLTDEVNKQIRIQWNAA